MDEILNKLVESELLNEETKASLVEAFTSKLSEAVEAAKAEAADTVRAELTEQFVIEKEMIIEALDTKAQEFLKKHFEELQEDIEAFRDLEAEYAARLVEEREVMAKSLKKDMADLVEKLDQFNTEWMQEAFVEFEDSINEVKQIQFGKAIFEAYAKTFQQNFSDSNATLNQLKEAEQKLEETTKELEKSKQLLEQADREHKLNAVLENLHGRPREIMAYLLTPVPTDKLEEGYNKFIGRVLGGEYKTDKENADQASVLAEAAKDTPVTEDVIRTGDSSSVITESKQAIPNNLTDENKKRLERLAGLID